MGVIGRNGCGDFVGAPVLVGRSVRSAGERGAGKLARLPYKAFVLETGTHSRTAFVRRKFAFDLFRQFDAGLTQKRTSK